MYRKDTSYLLNNTNSSSESSVLIDDSIDVSKLVKIETRINGKGYSDIVTGSIKRDIDYRTLKSIGRIYFAPKDKIERKGKKEWIPFLEDTDKEYIAFRYPDKPTIYISRKDGLLYAFNNGIDERKQGWYLLRILSKFGYVENWHRQEHHRSRRTKRIVDGWMD
jgi:hypothetical protein